MMVAQNVLYNCVSKDRQVDGCLKFPFLLVQVADNATLYGVCLHVMEIVQRPPGILGVSSPLSHSSAGCNRFLVSAPRCYCVLTRVPFFELHYEMLNRFFFFFFPEV